MKLYHGTSTGYLDQILCDGLLPQSSYKGYICYSDDIDIAKHHAECAAKWDECFLPTQCSPIVFEIPFSRFNPDRFCIDENFIELGPSSGKAVGLDMKGRHWTWESLLAESGAVGYADIMRVSMEDVIDIL